MTIYSIASGWIYFSHGRIGDMHHAPARLWLVRLCLLLYYILSEKSLGESIILFRALLVTSNDMEFIVQVSPTMIIRTTK